MSDASARPSLVFRADADGQIGTGHVMRCLALAQAWQDAGGRAILGSRACPAPLAARLRAEGIEVEDVGPGRATRTDAVEVISLAARSRADWVVVDGYAFNADYQDELRRADLSVLLIDDYGGAARYTADIVLNQNPYASESLYTNRAAYTRLLLGLQYGLLRREFSEWAERPRPVARVGARVLVTLGGSDPVNATSRVLEAIARLDEPRLECIAVLGAAAAHRAEVERIAAADPRVRVLESVANVPELMAWADMAVTGGGSTCYEAALLGLPSMVLVVADNQRAVAEALAERGVVESLGWHESVPVTTIAARVRALLADPDARARMSRNAQDLVRGSGARRVVESIAPREGLVRSGIVAPTGHQDR